MHAIKKTLFPFFLSSFFLIAAQVPKLSEEKGIKQAAEKHIRLVVLVHGTISPTPTITTFFYWLKNLCGIFLSSEQQEPSHFCKNPLSKSYQAYLDCARFDSVQQHQPIGKLGLEFFTPEQEPRASDRGTFARLYLKNPKLLSENYSYRFYTFGWDGRLDKMKRFLWAQVFYKKIAQEINRLKTENPQASIEIEIYAHSHGGNVVLNMAEAEEKFHQKIFIDRVVLLGTPVQESTQMYILHPMFKKIFHVYSPADLGQILDQGISLDGPSNRTFYPIVHPKLTEVEVCCDSIYPNHWELWLSQACRKSIIGCFLYRRYLPISPYPVVVFLPRVLDEIDNGKKHPWLKLDIAKNKKRPPTASSDPLSFFTCTVTEEITLDA